MLHSRVNSPAAHFLRRPPHVPPHAHPPILLQATTNALLSHFFSLVCSLWLLRIIANRPSAGHMLTSGGTSNQIIATGSSSNASPRPAAA